MYVCECVIKIYILMFNVNMWNVEFNIMSMFVVVIMVEEGLYKKSLFEFNIVC